MAPTRSRRASVASRLAAGLLGLSAVVLVPPALLVTLSAIGGRAPDFSGRALSVAERLGYAAVPIAVVALFWIAALVWRGSHRASIAAAVIGLGVGAFLVVRLIRGFADAPPDGLSIDLGAAGGLVVVAAFELLLRRGAQAPTEA